MKTIHKLWIGLGILAVVSPAGLYLPHVCKAGSAWGEWGTDEIKELTGYVPVGLAKLSSLWKAALPDYAFKNSENLGMGHLSFSYIISALLGILLCAGAVWLLGKLLVKKGT